MIEVKDLTKYYGDICAVDHITFTIKKGEVLGLLGPNGAGKTTTLRILTSYLRPSAGEVTVQGLNINDHAQQIKSMLGYLPENAPLYGEMLVYDYLDFVAAVRGLQQSKKRERIDHLAEVCRIREVMHQPVADLSKGYKQRVGLAQAMMGDPEILVLDEPTSGLDPNQIMEIRSIIKKLGEEKTIILSTHILSEAEATCDRVVIIHKGRIVADGPIEELKQSLTGEATIHLTLHNADYAAVQRKLGSLTGIRSLEKSADSDNGLQITLHTESSQDLRPHLYQAIKQEDWVLVEMFQHAQSLENVFRELTKE